MADQHAAMVALLRQEVLTFSLKSAEFRSRRRNIGRSGRIIDGSTAINDRSEPINDRSEPDKARSEAYSAHSAAVQGDFDTRTASARSVDGLQGAKVSRAGRLQACWDGNHGLGTEKQRSGRPPPLQSVESVLTRVPHLLIRLVIGLVDASLAGL